MVIRCLLLCLGLVQISARTDTIPRASTPNYFSIVRSGAWEEHHVLKSLPPCRIVGLRIFYLAKAAGDDTLHITTTSRIIPAVPLAEHWQRAAIAYPIVVNITSDTQFVEVDLRSQNIRLSGYEGLIVSHRTNDGDRYWATRTGPYINANIDSESYSMTVDRNDTKPRFIPIAQKFCIQVMVEHDYEIEATHVRPQSGSMLAEYNTIAAWEYGSNNASVVDLNADGFDDVMFDSLLTLNRNAGELNLRTVFVKPADAAFGADISAWADIDRDGDQDCIIHDHITQALRLLRTDSAEHFTDITSASGIGSSGATAVLLWFDADNDGDPDFFVGRDGQDMLWLNNGAGVFVNATVSAGLAAVEPQPYDVCGSASLGDINADGFTDIMVVTRDNKPDRLMVNNGAGKFTLISAPGRIGSISPGSHGNGEGAEWGDFNGDGFEDILVANSFRVDEPDVLQDASVVWRTKSRSPLSFDTLWTDLGLPFVATTNGYTSADVNLDGLTDFVNVVPDTQIAMSDRAYVSVLTQQVDAGRRTYSHDAFAFGLPITDVGFALRTDIDMDGDQDFIVNRTSVLRNNLSNANNGITIRLRNEGRTSITQDCFGSHVTVVAGNTTKRMFFPGTISTGRGSTNSAAMTFGLGEHTVADSIIVLYSDKSKRTFRNVAANGAYILGTSGSVQRIVGPPRQQQPVFNAVDVAANPRFEWSGMGAGISYDLQISRDDDFLTVLRDIKAITTVTHDLAVALPTFEEYYWRIRAHFANGAVSHWSTAWPLTVGKVIPGGLQLQSPPDGSVTYLPDAVLRWIHQNDSRQINARSEYRAQVATDLTFTNVLADVTVEELQTSIESLSPSSTYYWRVQPIQSGVSGTWSSVWSFSTTAFPAAIELLTPPNGQENVDAITRLTWRKPEGLDPRFLGTYLMHFTLDSLCQDILDTGTTGDTVEVGQYLLLNQKYYWRVRLVTTFGYGPWSQIWSFTTGWVLDVDDDVSTGPRTTAPRVFPMPFADRLTVGLPLCTWAHVKVHDMNGILLYELDIRDAATSESIDIVARDWPSGPLVVTVEADGQYHRVMAIHLP